MLDTLGFCRLVSTSSPSAHRPCGPEPTAIDLVLKQMPLPAVIKIDGLFVCARCGNPVERDELFLAKDAVDQPVPVDADRIARADRQFMKQKNLENGVHHAAVRHRIAVVGPNNLLPASHSPLDELKSTPK